MDSDSAISSLAFQHNVHLIVVRIYPKFFSIARMFSKIVGNSRKLFGQSPCNEVGSLFQEV